MTYVLLAFLTFIPAFYHAKFYGKRNFLSSLGSAWLLYGLLSTTTAFFFCSIWLHSDIFEIAVLLLNTQNTTFVYRFSGCFIVQLCVLFFIDALYHKLSAREQVTTIRNNLLTFFFFLLIFLSIAASWILHTYPVQNAESVIITLSLPLTINDTSEGMFFTFSFFLYATIYCFIFFLCFAFCMSEIKKDRKTFVLRYAKYMLFLGYIAFFAVLLATLPIARYIQAYNALFGSAVPNEFYNTYYVSTETTAIHFPEKKRNVLVIFLESWENAFLDEAQGGVYPKNLMPEFCAIAEKNLYFSNTSGIGGGYDLYNTNSTISATVAKFSATPMILWQTPAKPSEEFDDSASQQTQVVALETVTINDILKREGYNQIFSYAYYKEFAATGLFFETHGNIPFHDLPYFEEKHGNVPDEIKNRWGFDDYLLYTFAKQELTELAAADKPFFYGLALADSHTGDYKMCALCEKPKENTKEYRIKSVIRCMDKQFAEFIRWAEAQSWYENTTIVIFGDHTFPLPEQLPKKLETHVWLNCFINPAVTTSNTKNRQFSSFDMYPTILEAMGVTVEGHALGFGRSLFSDKPTILEETENPIYVNLELSKPIPITLRGPTGR